MDAAHANKVVVPVLFPFELTDPGVGKYVGSTAVNSHGGNVQQEVRVRHAGTSSRRIPVVRTGLEICLLQMRAIQPMHNMQQNSVLTTYALFAQCCEQVYVKL